MIAKEVWARKAGRSEACRSACHEREKHMRDITKINAEGNDKPQTC